MLKSSGHIRKSKRHDTSFKRAVAGVESGLPFIALADRDQVVRVTEANFCIESRLTQAVREVGVLEPGQRLWCLKLKHYNLDRP